MNHIRMASPIIMTLVFLSLPDLTEVQLGHQEANLVSSWKLDTESGIPFRLAGNLVLCSTVPSSRKMFVFMEPHTFSDTNLVKVFRHLSDKYVHPEFLTIFVRTDPGVLQKWMDLYMSLSSLPPDDRAFSTCGVAEDELYERTRIGCYQAEYFRSSRSESFSYSLDTLTGERKTVRLSTSPSEFAGIGDVNANLLEAVWEGCINCVKSLLAQGAQVNWENRYGMTPLVAAVYLRHITIVKLLLDQGADINTNSYNGWTSLLWAADDPLGESLAVELVKRGADVNALSPCGDTALILAVRKGVAETRLVKYLLSKGADFTVEDKYGRTPLQIAEKHHHSDIASLLKKKGAVK